MSFDLLRTFLVDFITISKDFATGVINFLFNPQTIGNSSITPIYPLFTLFASVAIVKILFDIIIPG